MHTPNNNIAMIEIKFNNKDVTEVLGKLVGHMQDMRPVGRDIGEYMIVATKQRFARGESPDGEKWKPNTQTTILQYLRLKSGGTVLRKGEKAGSKYYRKDNGRLTKAGAGVVMGKRPLIGESKRLSKEIFYSVTGNGVVIGTNLIQAAVMQHGAKKGEFGKTKRGAPIPWGDIPSRAFLGISEGDKTMIMEIVAEHLDL